MSIDGYEMKGCGEGVPMLLLESHCSWYWEEIDCAACWHGETIVVVEGTGWGKG